jgi:hypothetical protein
MCFGKLEADFNEAARNGASVSDRAGGLFAGQVLPDVFTKRVSLYTRPRRRPKRCPGIAGRGIVCGVPNWSYW